MVDAVTSSQSSSDHKSLINQTEHLPTQMYCYRSSKQGSGSSRRQQFRLDRYYFLIHLCTVKCAPRNTRTNDKNVHLHSATVVFVRTCLASPKGDIIPLANLSSGNPYCLFHITPIYEFLLNIMIIRHLKKVIFLHLIFTRLNQHT